MHRMTSADIKGSYATLLLPINKDETISFDRLREEIRHLIEASVDGIYSNGTAGEFYTQNEQEFRQIQEILADECSSAGMPFQIGASQMSPQMTIERIIWAKTLNPSAIQVILSDWFPLTDTEVFTCLERYAAAADPVGIVLYNPPHAKRVLSPELIGRIERSIPGVVGVKVADGDEQWYARMRQHVQRLSVFVPGHHMATGIAQGMHGAYSNVSCLSPAGASRWYKMCHQDLEGALELEERILQVMREYILPYIETEHYCNAACDKLLAAIGNWAPLGTRLRWPYRWIPESEASRLRPHVRNLVPELF